MNPKNVQLIQNDLAIAWDDGAETYIPLERLRRRCPCAMCSGERDVLGKEYKPASQEYTIQSFVLSGFQTVGGYALSFAWGDGHQAGIYSYPLLKKLGEL